MRRIQWTASVGLVGRHAPDSVAVLPRIMHAPTPLLPATPTNQPTPDMPTPTLSALLDRHLETNVAKDIAYTSEQKMDIYSPNTPGDWPIVVVLHGGGSTKSEVQGISQAIAQRGAVVFAPQYRSSEPLLPSDSITQGPEDAACAVRFARARAAGYGTKPTPRLILVGHSAGGAIGMTVMLAGGRLPILSGFSSGCESWDDG